MSGLVEYEDMEFEILNDLSHRIEMLVKSVKSKRENLTDEFYDCFDSCDSTLKYRVEFFERQLSKYKKLRSDIF